MFAKRLISALTAALLLAGSTALADEWGLSHSLDTYWDVDDLRFTATARLDALLPYGESTVEMFNAALEGLSVSAEAREGETSVRLCVAGDPVASFTEARSERGTALTTPLLPNRTLVSASSAMDAISGNQEVEPAFDLFAAIQEAEGCYQALTDAILPYATEKKANYKIKNVGHSKWSRIARLTPEQGAELSPLIAQVLGCGMDAALREKLSGMTYGKGFIVGLYQSAEGGDDMAVYIKGNVTFPDGAKRAISYQWAFAQTEAGPRVDTYKFELTKSRAPRDNREISASYERSAGEGALLLKGECAAKITDPETGVTTSTTLTHDLSGSEAGGARPVSGSVKRVVKTTADGKTQTETSTLTPELTLTLADGSGVLSGSVKLEHLSGKQADAGVSLLFDENAARDFAQAAQSGALYSVSDSLMPPTSLTQNREPASHPSDYLVGQPPAGYFSYAAPDSPQTIDLDAADATQRDALAAELSQNLAGRLLVALAKLPEENTALLRDLLSDADYAAFLALVDEL